jgi:hypothetical protein
MSENPYEVLSLPTMVTVSKSFATTLIAVSVITSFLLGAAFGYEYGVYTYRKANNVVFPVKQVEER